MADNKRRFSRIPFSIKAEITINNESFSVDTINDIGVGGGSFPITAQPESGTICTVKIFLEGVSSELSINIEGKVLRSDPGAVIVQFVRIDPDSLYHLQNIIRYNAPDPDAVEEEINKHPGLI